MYFLIALIRKLKTIINITFYSKQKTNMTIEWI